MIRGNMTVAVRGWRGIAFNVLQRRGTNVQVVMVGDDKVRTVQESDCKPLRNGYCRECGQIGCSH